MTAGVHDIGVYDLSRKDFVEEFKTTANRYILSFADIIGEEF